MLGDPQALAYTLVFMLAAGSGWGLRALPADARNGGARPASGR